MSTTLDEKLATHATTSGPARRSLDSLKNRQGYEVLSGPESKPARVRVEPMDTPSEWVRRSDGEYERAEDSA